MGNKNIIKPGLKTLIGVMVIFSFLLCSPSFFPLDAGMNTVSAEDKALRYHCPMHPTIVSDHTGDCPVCGMRLVPIEDDEETNEVSPTQDAGTEGRAKIKLSGHKRQLIGVRTAPVEKEPLVRTIRTVGIVTPDETRLNHVHTKVSGWIEKLHANETGIMIKKGDPLITIYSPELAASAQDYLIALKGKEKLSRSTLPLIQQSGDRLLESARQRLLLFDITPEQIKALENDTKAPTSIVLDSPINGHILKRNVTQGEQIEPGTNLFDIADLSKVWVLADIYEYELPFIFPGQKATITLSYLPGRTFNGNVTLIYPVVSAATRTVKARLEFDNEDYVLKPEMYAEVKIHADLGVKLVVPESAVISTGKRDIVFIEVDKGYFEPREIKIGARLADNFEILEGLAEGEMILVSGNFLVDSESKLKAAMSESRNQKNDHTPGHIPNAEEKQ